MSETANVVSFADDLLEMYRAQLKEMKKGEATQRETLDAAYRKLENARGGHREVALETALQELRGLQFFLEQRLRLFSEIEHMSEMRRDLLVDSRPRGPVTLENVEKTAAELEEQGLKPSTRNIGQRLGISAARVSQLRKAAAEAGSSPSDS